MLIVSFYHKSTLLTRLLIALVCHPVATPVDTKPKLGSIQDAPYDDPIKYRQLAGALQYLTFTRPDISYALQHVFTCMIREIMLIWMLLSAFCAIYRVLSLLACISIRLLLGSWFFILMQIGVNVPTLDALPRLTVFSLVTISFLGPSNNNILSQNPVARLNTEVLLTPFPNHAGFRTYYWSFISYP